MDERRLNVKPPLVAGGVGERIQSTMCKDTRVEVLQRGMSGPLACGCNRVAVCD